MPQRYSHVGDQNAVQVPGAVSMTSDDPSGLATVDSLTWSLVDQAVRHLIVLSRSM
jgi:hypothetical protein